MSADGLRGENSGRSGEWARRQAKLVGFLLMGIALVLALQIGSRALQSVTESGETFAILNEAGRLPDELAEAVTWAPDADDLHRPVEPLTREEVGSTWIRAWQQLQIAASTGDTSDVNVYFSRSARDAAMANMADAGGWRAEQIAHRLKVNFYSADGQIMGLAAEPTELVRSVPIPDGRAWFHTIESFEAVLVLDDGNWRIHHWVRRSLQQSDPTQPVDAPDDGVAVRPEAPEVGNGVNYYSRQHPFDEFWPNYDSDVTARDFDRAVDLGFGSIRIFLPFHEFGGADVSNDRLDPVIDLLDLAHERSLGVVVTLFDGRTDHRPSNWDADRRHLDAVIPALADHPAVILWDLKNEPDRDYGANGVNRDLARTWLWFVGRRVRDLDPATPITIGWSTAEAALDAPVITDLVSFHHYGTVEELDTLLPRLIEHADGRPVMLGEYGLPTWNSVVPGGHTEREQLVYLAGVRRAAERYGLSGAMVWTLWDLDRAPHDVGRAPWRTGPQRNLGLLRSDGSAKPAADLFRGDIDPATVEPFDLPGQILNRLRKRFWQAALASLVIVGLVVNRGIPLPRRGRRSGTRRERKAARAAAHGSPRQRPMPAKPSPEDSPMPPGRRHRSVRAVLNPRGRRFPGRKDRRPDRPPDAP